MAWEPTRGLMANLWEELDAFKSPVDDRTRWVMGRAAYDLLRAALVTEARERVRAQAHASMWISSEMPFACPACPSGPFATMAELSAHAASMADATNREPQDGDMVLGIRIEVREDAAEPRLQQLTG